MGHKSNVLILCTGNSARSQMAEGLMRKYGGVAFAVHSAGINPKPIHPLAIQVMEEIGIDITGQRSKDVVEYLGKLPVRHLLIVCAKAQASCSTVWPGVLTRTFWNLDDPAAVEGDKSQRIEAFRAARDELEVRIRNWLAEIGIHPQT